MSTVLLHSYLLRVAIRDNRWQLQLQDLRTGEALTFASFRALHEHLEASAWRRNDPPAPGGGA